MKVYHKLAIIAVAVMTGGVAILAIALTFTYRASFYWPLEHPAAKFDSLSYSAFVAAAGKSAGAPPTHWTWGDTLGITAGVYMIFVWTFAISLRGR